jgi:hypothetical protein
MCPFPEITQNLTEGKVMGFDFNREVDCYQSLSVQYVILR